MALPPPLPNEYDTIWPSKSSTFIFGRVAKADELQFLGYKRKRGKKTRAEQKNVIRKRGDVVVAIDGISMQGKKFAEVNNILINKTDQRMTLRMRQSQKAATSPFLERALALSKSSIHTHPITSQQPMEDFSLKFNPQHGSSLTQADRTPLSSFERREAQLKEEINHHRREIERLQEEQRRHEAELARKEKILFDAEQEEILRMETRLQELKNRAADRNIRPIGHEAAGNEQRANEAATKIDLVTEESSSTTTTSEEIAHAQLEEARSDVAASSCGQKRKAPPLRGTQDVDKSLQPPPWKFTTMGGRGSFGRPPSLQPSPPLASAQSPPSWCILPPHSTGLVSGIPQDKKPKAQVPSVSGPLPSTSEQSEHHSTTVTNTSNTMTGPRNMSNLPAWLTRGGMSGTSAPTGYANSLSRSISTREDLPPIRL